MVIRTPERPFVHSFSSATFRNVLSARRRAKAAGKKTYRTSMFEGLSASYDVSQAFQSSKFFLELRLLVVVSS